MKTLKKIVFLILISILFIPSIKAESKIDIHLFYSELCSTCKAEKEYLEEFSKNNNVNVILYEVTKNEENAKLLNDVRNSLKNKELTTPYTVIGTMGITGFSETVESQIESAYKKYSNEEYIDIVNVVKNNLDIEYEIDYPEGEYNLPLLGKIDPKSVSLPIVAIVVGFIDGFNPCAMWVLLFLISMIIGMKNRKKMWIIGLTFLITSALIYLGFMLAWLQVAITLTQISWVRLIIGLIALIGGSINLISYYKERKKADGCHVVDSKKRKTILSRIKGIIKHAEEDKDTFWKTQGTFILALIGIIGLAISVNLIELACSSGLPLIFTQILALNDLNSLQYFLYILLYVIFFLIDDIVIFAIAMKSLKVTGISTKYNKLSHLIGGILMLLIGILMILKPDWLMFNF